MPTCQYCEKEYSYKKNLLSHETVCKFMRTQTQHRNLLLDRADDSIPTNRELYELLKTQSLRIDHLETENRLLKKQQKRKLNMLTWLNETRQTPQHTYSEWLKQLLLTVPTFLPIAFKETLFAAISQLIKEIDTTTLLPICAYDNKTSQFYIYSSESEGWTLFTITEVECMLKKISDRFYIDFVEVWYKGNQSRLMNNDKLYDEFIQNQGKVSCVQNYTKLRQTLYIHIVQTVGSIIEYEFE